MKSSRSLNSYHGDETEDIPSTLHFLRHSRMPLVLTKISRCSRLGLTSHEIPGGGGSAQPLPLVSNVGTNRLVSRRLKKLHPAPSTVTVLVSKTFKKFSILDIELYLYFPLTVLLWRPSVHSFWFPDKLVFAFQWFHCLLTPISSYINPLIVTNNPSFRHFFCKLLIIVNLHLRKFLW